MNPSEIIPPESESAIRGATPKFYAALLMTDLHGSTIERDILRETTLIGAGRGCDVRLKSEDVAPAHCILSLEGGTLRIRDLGSAVGTIVNGERIQTAILGDGDELRLGRHRMRVETNLIGQAFRGFYIDLYHVHEILGSGGMCWIYGARNSVSRERVALKVLPSHHSPRMLAHFGIEARVGLKLDHPNIGRVGKIAQVDSLYFLVMEYIEGVNLQELIEAQGRIPWRQACHFGCQLARCLDHVHERGIVHRDMKPANVICTREGQVKLIDFGLAKLADDNQQEKLSKLYANQILGTADFISPEQSRQSHEVDGRADLYSLGCSLYLAITGALPFPMLSVRDKVKAHRHQAPRDPRELIPDLPDPVAEMLLQLMAKSRDDRPPNGEAVIAQLAPFAEAMPVEFDWPAVLSVRVAAAHRRLSKLLLRRRQSGDPVPEATVVLDVVTTPPAAAKNRRLIEADFMEFLQQSDPLPPGDRANWGELFEIWTQLVSEQRTQLMETARSLQADAHREADKGLPEATS